MQRKRIKLSAKDGCGRNVPLMLCITLLQGLVFYSALATAHKRALGLSLLDITAIEGFHTLLMLVLILPWGVFADRVGYKRTLILCNALYLISKVCFWAAEGYTLFLLERLFRAAAVSGLSTCSSAFLYLSARDDGGKRAFSRYTAASAAGVLISSFALSSVLQSDVRLASALTMAAFLAAFVLTLFLKEVRPGLADGGRTLAASLKKVCRAIITKSRFLLFIVAAALFDECAYLVTIVLNQPFFVRAGIPEESFGYLYALSRGLTMLAVFSPSLVGRFGERRTVIGLLTVGMLSCAALALWSNPFVTVSAVILLRTAAGLFSPIKMTVQNREIDVEERATMLAAFFIVTRSCMAASDWAAGAAAEVNIVLCAFLLSGLLLLACLLYTHWSRD